MWSPAQPKGAGVPDRYPIGSPHCKDSTCGLSPRVARIAPFIDWGCEEQWWHCTAPLTAQPTPCHQATGIQEACCWQTHISGVAGGTFSFTVVILSILLLLWPISIKVGITANKWNIQERLILISLYLINTVLPNNHCASMHKNIKIIFNL